MVDIGRTPSSNWVDAARERLVRFSAARRGDSLTGRIHVGSICSWATAGPRLRAAMRTPRGWQWLIVQAPTVSALRRCIRHLDELLPGCVEAMRAAHVRVETARTVLLSQLLAVRLPRGWHELDDWLGGPPAQRDTFENRRAGRLFRFSEATTSVGRDFVHLARLWGLEVAVDRPGIYRAAVRWGKEMDALVVRKGPYAAVFIWRHDGRSSLRMFRGFASALIQAASSRWSRVLNYR